MKTTTVRFDAELWKLLEAQASRAGTTVAEYVREAARTRAECDALGAESEEARPRPIRWRDAVDAPTFDARWEIVFHASPDWSEVRTLDGRGPVGAIGSTVGGWLDAYVHPDDRPRVTGSIQQAIDRKDVLELEHRLRASTCAQQIRWRAVPLLNDDGEITEWLGTARNVARERDAAEANRSTAASRRPQTTRHAGDQASRQSSRFTLSG